MKNPANSWLPVFLFAVTFVRADVGVGGEKAYHVTDSEDLVAVQALIRAPVLGDPTPLIVRLESVTFVLEDTLSIGRSNVMIIGKPGTRLVLADHVNKPVISVGSQAEYVTANDMIENITITCIEIDGNMKYQDSETGVDKPWIRNNGIDVRAVRHLTVERVKAGKNRSGGLVISWGSSDVRIADCVFEENFFDGIAFYSSTRISVINSTMKNNGFAGISLDNDLLESEFSGCVLDSNRNVGVFARNSSNLTFKNCVIENSGDWGVFLAHDEKNRGVHDVEFAVCQVSNNHGGLFMASAKEYQSSGARVISSTFNGNERDGRRNIETSGSTVWTAGNIELH